jgi:Fe-S-cluster containining protein
VRNQTFSGPIPCDELLPICEGRCCKLQVERSRGDAEGGPVRWDPASGRWVLQREDGYCVHSDRERRCEVYADRPISCREFDCRNDPRIWIDFEERILAPYFAIDSAQRCATVPSVCVPLQLLW